MPDELSIPDMDLMAIGDRVKPIIAGLPREKAIQVGWAIESEVFHREKTPWVVIVTADGIDAACEKLLHIIHTPNNLTYTYDTQITTAATLVKKILKQEKLFDYDTSRRLVEAYITLLAADEPNPIRALNPNIGQPSKFELYIDEGRDHFTEALRWEYKLSEQFGGYEVVQEAKKRHPELFKILEDTDAAGQEFNQILNAGVRGEIEDVFADLVSVLASGQLSKSAWQAYEKLAPYREKTYAIRKIPNIHDNPYDAEMGLIR